MKDALKAKKVYVIDDKELYGAGVAKLFMEACKTKEIGIEILGHDQVVKANTYKTLLEKVAKLAPDAIYVGATSQSGAPQIAIDMLGAGLKCPLVVPDGCYERAFIDGAGADVFKKLTCYATIGGEDPALLTGRGAAFVKKYKETHKEEPEAYAVYGYEAAKVVLEAIKAAGKKDRDAIRNAVLATKDFDKGALGKWSFDADGDTTLRVLTVSKIEDGKFKPVKLVQGSGR